MRYSLKKQTTPREVNQLKLRTIALGRFTDMWDAWLGQLQDSATLDLGFVTSSPTLGIEISKIKKQINLREKKRRYTDTWLGFLGGWLSFLKRKYGKGLSV